MIDDISSQFLKAWVNKKHHHLGRIPPAFLPSDRYVHLIDYYLGRRVSLAVGDRNRVTTVLEFPVLLGQCPLLPPTGPHPLPLRLLFHVSPSVQTPPISDALRAFTTPWSESSSRRTCTISRLRSTLPFASSTASTRFAAGKTTPWRSPS